MRVPLFPFFFFFNFDFPSFYLGLSLYFNIYLFSGLLFSLSYYCT